MKTIPNHHHHHQCFVVQVLLLMELLHPSFLQAPGRRSPLAQLSPPSPSPLLQAHQAAPPLLVVFFFFGWRGTHSRQSSQFARMAAAAAMLRLADEFDNSTTSPPPTFNSTTQPPNIPHGANVPTGFLIAAGCLALIAIGSSLFLIYKHLRNYTEPRFQKPIIRILFMVPVRRSMCMIEKAIHKDTLF